MPETKQEKEKRILKMTAALKEWDDSAAKLEPFDEWNPNENTRLAWKLLGPRPLDPNALIFFIDEILDNGEKMIEELLDEDI
jgi:hypothetical protein